MEKRNPKYLPKNARNILAEHGYSYKEFAQKRGYNYKYVINVFNKYSKGTKSVPRGRKVLMIIGDFYSLTKESII